MHIVRIYLDQNIKCYFLIQNIFMPFKPAVDMIGTATMEFLQAKAKFDYCKETFSVFSHFV